MTTQKNRTRLRISYVDPHTLHPDAGNPRRISAAEDEALTRSIAVRDGIRRLWRGLRCYEIVLAALAANEFNNDDPLHPKIRKVLRAVRRHLSVLAQELKPYAGEVELPEPNPDEIELLKHTIMRSAERYHFSGGNAAP